MKINNYNEYISKIKNIFLTNNMKEILSTDLKQQLGLMNSGSLYGTIISMLISKKLIKKVEGKQTKINGKGKPVFYYEPGEKLLTEDDTQKNITKTYIIQDQFKNNYDYPSDELLEEKLEQLIYDNPKL